MNENYEEEQKNNAGKVGTFLFLIIALYIFISDKGVASLFSIKGVLFLTVGMFVSAIVIGMLGYFLNKIISKTLVKIFKNPFSKEAIKITQIISLIVFVIEIMVTFLLTQFTYDSFIKAPDGVFVEISLQNDKNISGYVIFNSDVKSLEECEQTFAEALPDIMVNLPAPIPKNSIATGWKCSLTDPAKDNE